MKYNEKFKYSISLRRVLLSTLFKLKTVNGDVIMMVNSNEEKIKKDYTRKTDMLRLTNDIAMGRLELKKLLKRMGINNIRFVMYILTLDYPIPIGPSSNTLGSLEFVECRIDESIHEVADWYKITLVPIEETGKFGYTHLYVTTLVSQINGGEILLKSAN